MKKTLNVVGCGRVGQTLARLLHASGACDVQDITSSSMDSTVKAVEFIQAGRPVESVAAMRPADFWMFTVPDRLIGDAAKELAAALPPADSAAGLGPIAFHCSGFTPASALEPLRSRGFQLVSAHPNLTFADPAAAVAQFKGTPCGLEGGDAAMVEVQALFEAIGALCFPIRTEHKALYHAAAVFSNNFTVVLQAIACEAWAAAGIPAPVAAKIHAALLEATVPNVLRFGPEALTGPAARGDMKVVHAQGAAVYGWQPDAGVIYQEMSRLARNLALHKSPFGAINQETTP